MATSGSSAVRKRPPAARPAPDRPRTGRPGPAPDAQRPTPEQQTANSDGEEEHDDIVVAAWRSTLPAGLTSMVFHIVVLLAAALWMLPEPEKENDPPIIATRSDEPEPEEFVEEEFTLDEPEEEVDFDTPVETTDPPDEFVESTQDITSEFNEDTAAEVLPALEIPALTEFGELSSEVASTLPVVIGGSAISGRGKTQRVRSAREKGGTPHSEAAVENALRWIVAHQNADGSWGWDHRHTARCNCGNPGSEKDFYGSTGIALSALLGAGYSHKEGPYKKQIDAGLKYLIKSMKRPKPDVGKMLGEGHAGMYSHGLATLALCEAYGLTYDSSLEEPAQAGLNWIIQSQAASGFWGYHGGGNDTSVSGWQFMALKSGYAAGLEIPDKTVEGIRKGLDGVAGGGGAFYGYKGPSETFRDATTAIGLLGRMYTGWPNSNPALARGMNEIVKKGPDAKNMYYLYYATQAMYQYTSGQGPAWQSFNQTMRDGLVLSQARAGHEAGSWKHGRFNSRGGRLYSTALAAMCLEVYYRYKPVYQKTRKFGVVKKTGKGFAGDKPKKGGPKADETEAWDLD